MTAAQTTAPAGNRPTTYGTLPGFDYDRAGYYLTPSAYVVASGMAHFRGPDGHLWFAPDAEAGGFDWGNAQNVAEFDARTDGASPEVIAAMGDLCRAVDVLRAASARWDRATTDSTDGR